MTVIARHGQFPDPESLLKDMAASIEVDGEPLGGRAGTSTPVAVDDFYLHVIRAAGSGGLNSGAWSDSGLLYAAAWAPTRAQTMQLVDGLRALLEPLAVFGGEHRGVLIDRMWETSAPGPLPTGDEDDRRRELGIGFRFRKHDGADVYTQ